MESVGHNDLICTQGNADDTVYQIDIFKLWVEFIYYYRVHAIQVVYDSTNDEKSANNAQKSSGEPDNHQELVLFHGIMLFQGRRNISDRSCLFFESRRAFFKQCAAFGTELVGILVCRSTDSAGFHKETPFIPDITITGMNWVDYSIREKG